MNKMLSIFDHKIIKENIKSYSDFWKFVEILQSFMKEKGKEVSLKVTDDGRDSIEISISPNDYLEFKERYEKNLKISSKGDDK